MLGLLFGWLISFFIHLALVGLVGYQIICLSDLECDHINPYDSATRINQVIIPEFVAQGGLCFVFFITGHWLLALLCVPYLYYNVKSYMSNRHLVHVTEIYNVSSWEKKKRLFKLGYLFFTLILSLLWLIMNTTEDDEFY